MSQRGPPPPLPAKPAHLTGAASNEEEDDKPSDGHVQSPRESRCARAPCQGPERRISSEIQGAICQLLGAAAKGQVAVDPNDKRRVVITELKVTDRIRDCAEPRSHCFLQILFEDRPGGDITYTLNTPQDVKAMKSKPFVCSPFLWVKSPVDCSACSTRLFQVYKAGLRLRKDEEMLGRSRAFQSVTGG
eukprot:753339-Hanusia_phi.AAC.1